MYNIKIFEEKVNSITEDNIKVLEFDGVKNPVVFECLKCHKITRVNRGEVLLRKGKTYQCSFCHTPKEIVTKKNFEKITFLAKESDIEIVSFTKTSEVATFKCNKCGGKFNREPLRFIKNQLCPICESKCVTVPLSVFKNRLAELEGYSLVKEEEYRSLHEKVLIRHECGFVWSVSPQKLLSGHSHCPKCSKKMSLGEKRVKKFLEEGNIAYIPQWQQTIEDHNLFFDFYLPHNNLAIEFQGEQHFRPVDWFGGEDAFLIRQQYDQLKRDWCKKNNIVLLEISWRDYDSVEEILKAQRLNVVSSETKKQTSRTDDDIV